MGCQRISAIHILDEKCKCCPIENKESKNQPIGDKKKIVKNVEC
jgi:hypothetical protein